MKKIIVVFMGIIVMFFAGVTLLSNVKIPEIFSFAFQDSNTLNHSDGRFCYAYHNQATKDSPYEVDESIDITISGNTIKGTKKGHQTGPDMNNGYQGTLTGTIDKDNLTSIFDYTIEGSHNKEKELYRFTKNDLEKLRYPLMNEKKVLVPDITKEFSIMNYSKVNCEGDSNNSSPVTLNTNYISSVNPWPPQVTFTDGTTSCNETGGDITQNNITAKKLIKGKMYCVTTQSEGAAGSTYTTYTYSLDMGSKTVSTSFVLRFVQCMNYDEPKQTECKNERSSFNADSLADTIIAHASKSN